MFLKPLADIHLYPNDPDTHEANDQADTLYAVGATGLLILLLAGINFVNLVTARATRRALEVGVRKALGGQRRQLLLQFMSESVAYALAGMLLGLALAEICVPTMNAFLDRQIAFDYWRHPLLAALPLAAAVLVGLVAGLYPAVVLSSFPPATVLKARSGGAVGGGRLRLALVVLQFTVTIGLLIATMVIYRQNVFATSQALRFDKDLVLTVDLAGMPWHETADPKGERDVAALQSLHDRFAAIPGVEAVASSLIVPQSSLNSTSDFERPGHADRPAVSLTLLPVDFDFFTVYGLQLVAGRGFSPDRSEDKVSVEDRSRLSSAILNETAARALGFAGPTEAIGQEIHTTEANTTQSSFRIIGVAPDFPIGSIRKPVPPTIFSVDPALFRVTSLKLSGARLSETLRAIDATWHEFVPDRPTNRSFVDDRVARLYLDITRTGRLFGGFACFAAAIGCLGLVGLSAYTAERRTKEIGIRKALGASTLDVTRLLIWQFVKPVLIANAIAWPIAWWFMRRWLDGFAYRIELGPTPFLVAGCAALAIAVATTAFHAFQVARSRPVLALRYE
ncbi:MAG: FtsX-like permease family protein [Aliidongia sp.]